ncbi:MAG: type II toxin-antitoxin system RelE family toxin [Pyrinomonadaceae bacterium]
MKYQVDFKPSAARELRKLPKDIAKRISKKIDSLADNPFPYGYTEMKGSQNYYRVKVGDYRIIYTVEHGEILILVVSIGHRREIYR